MNYSHKKIALFVIPILVALIFIIYATKTFNSVGVFLFDFSLSFLVIFSFLFFAKQEVFYVWLKFARIFIPISLIFILVSPTTGDALRLVFDKEEVTFFSAMTFSIMSLSLILVKSFRPNWRLWLILPLAFLLSIFGLLAVAIIS